MREIVTIELCSKEFEVEVEFSFTPEVPAKLTGHPDNQYPAVPESWEIYSLMLKDHEGVYSIDIGQLIDYIEDDIILAIKEQYEIK
jgi:hypothetical protein